MSKQTQSRRKGKRTRTKDQILRDRTVIAERYLGRETQAAIAEDLGITRSMVSRELSAIRDAWLKSAVRDFDQLKSEELARIDEVERQYWDAWQRSIGEKKRTATERSSVGDATRNRASVQTEEMLGNPEYLKGVERCIERRCKLLGLDAPFKVANTNPDGSEAASSAPMYFVMSDGSKKTPDDLGW